MITWLRKMIVGIVLAALLLTVGVVGVVKTFDKGFDNSEPTARTKKTWVNIRLQGNPKEEYVVNVDGMKL